MRRFFAPLAAFFALAFVPGPALHAVPASWSAVYQGVATTPTRVFLTTTGANTWTVPTNWNNSVIASNPYANKIECIGGGRAGQITTNHAIGGTGGGYAATTNITLTPGGSVNYSVGAAGAVSLGAGGDSFFGSTTCAGSTICAVGGASGSTAVGTTTFAGGTSSCASGTWCGGGGAAGPNGAGASVTNAANGGNADAGFGGAGGSSSNGGNGTEWDASHGSGGGGSGNTVANGYAGGLYGGGGGAMTTGGTAGVGGQGICVITYYALG